MMMNKRKLVKRGIFFACILFLLLIIAGIVTIVVLLSTTPKLSHGNAESTDPWRAGYYVFAIIGSVATLAAVIVALYKEEFMRWINSPDLEFSLIGNGLVANNDSQVGVTPDNYECSIRITNKGTSIATGCKVFIHALKYNKNRNKERLKPDNKVKNKKQLFWTSANVDIPVDIPSDIMLFQILNPNKIGTPQVGNATQNPKIVLNGCQLAKDKSEKGMWEIEYYISMKSGNVCKFLLTIDWDGSWCDNEDDMLDKVKIELKKL